MANIQFAEIDQNLVTVRTISETNSVTWKINLQSSNALSTKPAFLKINDVTVGTTPDNSVVVRNHTNAIDPRPFTQTNFKLESVNGTNNTNFVNQMKNASGRMVTIVVSGGVKSSPDVDAWFKSVGSVVWPGEKNANRFNFTYVAIYSGLDKKIISEAYNGENNIPNNGCATLETVIDQLSDVGATGYAQKAVYDPKEYVSTSEYEFKRYPNNLLVAKIADYGIRINTTMMLSAEMYQSKELVDAGLQTRLNLRWYKQNTLLDSVSVSVPVDVVDKWYKVRDIFTKVPFDADGFIIVTARYPRNDAVVALGSIRNVTFSQVGRGDEMGKISAIGVNGIRGNNFVESTIAPLLLEMPDSKITTDNKINVVGLKELENDY